MLAYLFERFRDRQGERVHPAFELGTRHSLDNVRRVRSYIETSDES